jgi:LAO/AO transport system kinase
MVADMTDCFLALMLPGAGDELQGIKRGLLELVDVIAVNKADGETRQAAQLAAQQLTTALRSLSPRSNDAPAVLTCSALQDEGVDAIWDAIQQRHEQMKATGELADRHRRQGARWLWNIVDDRLRQAVRNHPAVAVIREDLERDVLASKVPPEAAARQILEAFGLSDGCDPPGVTGDHNSRCAKN